MQLATNIRFAMECLGYVPNIYSPGFIHYEFPQTKFKDLLVYINKDRELIQYVKIGFGTRDDQVKNIETVDDLVNLVKEIVNV